MNGYLTWFRLDNASTNRIEKLKPSNKFQFLPAYFYIALSQLSFQLFQFKLAIRSHFADTVDKTNYITQLWLTPTANRKTELLGTSGTVSLSFDTCRYPI